MINYVNNSYDNVLKPCDAQRFSIITNSQETERLILAHRGGDAKAKAKYIHIALDRTHLDEYPFI